MRLHPALVLRIVADYYAGRITELPKGYIAVFRGGVPVLEER